MADNNALDYYKTRLGHTLDHTQKATQFIYVVNGAVLAAFYFLTGKDVTWTNKTHVGVYLLLILLGVNIIHARLISVQHRWYTILDENYSLSAGIEYNNRP